MHRLDLRAMGARWKREERGVWFVPADPTIRESHVTIAHLGNQIRTKTGDPTIGQLP